MASNEQVVRFFTAPQETYTPAEVRAFTGYRQPFLRRMAAEGWGLEPTSMERGACYTRAAVESYLVANSWPRRPILAALADQEGMLSLSAGTLRHLVKAESEETFFPLLSDAKVLRFRQA